ncbi:hypothetical protein [Candidatus Methanoplasma termitum]|uniref:hypothetical protein n=1 Tax=Candidatus Methanoplasma termitum TaxID=1577791 RepID=UPI0011DC9C05|nr:hypothetical protein [Candidatus Methanoplasma termitum]
MDERLKRPHIHYNVMVAIGFILRKTGRTTVHSVVAMDERLKRPHIHYNVMVAIGFILRKTGRTTVHSVAVAEGK